MRSRPLRARSVRTMLVSVVLVACATGTLGACGGSGYDAVKDHVVVVGDSIMVQSTQEVDAALRAAGWKSTVTGVSGSTIKGDLARNRPWSATVRRLVDERRPAVVVIELGTNDTAPALCCAHVPSDIDALMKQVRDVPHVLWLNVQEGRLNSQNAERVNQDLKAATKRWSNLRIVDFSGRFTGRPTWHLGPGPHLTPAGQVAFAQLVAQAAAPWAPGRS